MWLDINLKGTDYCAIVNQCLCLVSESVKQRLLRCVLERNVADAQRFFFL